MSLLVRLTCSSFKCRFSIEPYINLVKNRNQRFQLSRLRVSAHRLGSELQHYCRPQRPREQRYRKYCPPGPGPGGQAVRPVDSKCHCLTGCIVAQGDRVMLCDDIYSRNSQVKELCTVD